MLFMAKGERCLERGGGDFQRSVDGGSFSFVLFQFLCCHFAPIYLIELWFEFPPSTKEPGRQLACSQTL